MDLKELMAQHPGVYSAAVQAGVDQERERVMAHLKLGQASGAMSVALDAIKDGSALTLSLQADYMAAGLNRRDQSLRNADDATADAALTGANASDKSLDMQDRIAARLYVGAV